MTPASHVRGKSSLVTPARRRTLGVGAPGGAVLLSRLRGKKRKARFAPGLRARGPPLVLDPLLLNLRSTCKFNHTLTTAHTPAPSSASHKDQPILTDHTSPKRFSKQQWPRSSSPAPPRSRVALRLRPSRCDALRALRLSAGRDRSWSGERLAGLSSQRRQGSPQICGGAVAV